MNNPEAIPEGNAAPAGDAAVSWRAGDVVLCGLGMAVIVLAAMVGLAFNAVNAFLMLWAGLATLRALWAWRTGRLHTAFMRAPLAKTNRPWLVQAGVHGAFLVTWFAVTLVCLVPAQLGDQLAGLVAMLAICGAAWLLWVLVPLRTIRGARVVFVAALVPFFGAQVLMAAWSPANPVTLDSPFAGASLALQAGPSLLVNHHFLQERQRHAVDLQLLRDGQLPPLSARALTDHPCFGADVLAPADGRVVVALDGLADQPLGSMDTAHPTGNRVVMELAPGVFIMLAHLQQGSSQVTVGQQVTRGTVVARCGNSGNSSAPHLHLQVQDHAEFSADGLRTTPLVFWGPGDTVLVPRRNVVIPGQAESPAQPR